MSSTRSAGKPMWVRVVRRAECGMLPKAFLISSQAMDGSRLSACIIDNGFEEEGMFIASFAWSGTLLLGGEEVVGDGVVGHASHQYRH